MPLRRCRLLWAVAAVLVMPGCGGEEAGESPTVTATAERIRDAGSVAEEAATASVPGKAAMGQPENVEGERTPIVVHYHERVPYMYKEGTGVRGLTADRLAVVFEAAGVAYEWRETPPRRQIEILKEGRGKDVLLGWFRNEEREAYARFSLPIYRDLPTIALARAGKLDPAERPMVEEVLNRPGLRLLVRDGYSYGPFLDEWIAELSGNVLVTTVDNLAMAQMIEAGRADYFFIAEEEAQVVIEAAGIEPGELVEIRFSDMPAGNERCLMYSRNIEEELVERVDEAIRSRVELSVAD